MITSFFKPKGDVAPSSMAAAASPEQPKPSGGSKRVSLDADEQGSPPEAEEQVAAAEQPAGHAHKRLRKGKTQIDESDDDDESPAPAAAAPKEAELMETDAPAAEASSSSSSSSKAPAVAAPAAKEAAPAAAAKASVSAPAAVAAAEDGEEAEEAEEAEEEAEGMEENEGGAGPSEAKPLKLKQPKTKGKGAPSKKLGATATAVNYVKYDAASQATWKQGGDVPYLFLARDFGLIEEESKRLLITEMLANQFRTVITVSPQDLLPVVCLTTNKIAPDFENCELGIGDSIMIKAVAETCGRSVAAIKSQLETEGDLGVVALSSRGKQVMLIKPKPLTVRGVLKVLKEIAHATGKDVQTAKKEKVKQMLVSAQEKEAQYIVRALQGKMRIGASEQTVLVALAHAFALSEAAAGGSSLPRGEALQELLAGAEAVVKQQFSELPSFELIIPALLEHGLAKLHEHAALTAGIPVKPMLAKPTKGLSEVLDRFSSGRFTCEFKYDGERAQIHMKEDGTVEVFSRNSEKTTSKYPDIIKMLPAAMAPGVTSFILDAEAVAYDREKEAILPFQILSTRKRKDADVDDLKVQVCVYAFDMLYLNGESLLKKPLAYRREKLHESFAPIAQQFQFAIASDANDVEKIQEFLQESIKGNCEGLMVKTLDTDATYEPSKRSLNWLKVKKDYLQGMTDSCDLVPIGAYHGKGKRTGVYGAYLLACYNEVDEEYQSICKIGTGFSDEALKQHTEALDLHKIDAPRRYYNVPEGPSITPDVWFEPKQVWEVLAADLSVSPVHTAAAGMVDAAKGIALRFPRFLRLRDDKGPEDATNATQIAQMYNDQDVVKNSKKGGAAAQDDDDEW